MSVLITSSELMTSDRTCHQARYVGDGYWVSSWLPGRTLTHDQAIVAMRAAEEVSPTVESLHRLAGELGLTAREMLGLAARDCPWPPPDPIPAAGRRRRWSVA